MSNRTQRNGKDSRKSGMQISGFEMVGPDRWEGGRRGFQISAFEI
jgi:hypothetical protein